MTLTQLNAELRRVLNGSYAIDVQVWNHRHDGHECVVEWSIWNADTAIHYKAPTAEGALAKLLAALASNGAAAESPLDAVDANALETRA